MASQPAPITTNVVLHKKLNFDPTAFEPVAIMSKIPNVLLVREDFPAKTAQEFMDYVKAQSRQAQLRLAGDRHHLAPDRRTVPDGDRDQARPRALQGDRAGAQRSRRRPRRPDLHAARIVAIKLHEGGKARILAVTTDKRLPMLPDVPTMEEIGVRDLDVRHLERDHGAAQDAGARSSRSSTRRSTRSLKEPDVQAKFARSICCPAAAARRRWASSSRKRPSAGAR